MWIKAECSWVGHELLMERLRVSHNSYIRELERRGVRLRCLMCAGSIHEEEQAFCHTQSKATVKAAPRSLMKENHESERRNEHRKYSNKDGSQAKDRIGGSEL